MPTQRADKGLAPNCRLAGALADLSDVSAREAVGVLHKQLQVDVGRDGRLAQHRLEHSVPRRRVGQRNVDELIKAARAHERGVDDVRPVGRADDEHGLLRVDAVHFGEHLIEYTVTSAAAVARAATALGCDGVEFVKEEDAGRRLARLIKEVAHVGLALTEPHRQQLGALYRDEVGLRTRGDLLNAVAIWMPFQWLQFQWLDAVSMVAESQLSSN